MKTDFSGWEIPLARLRVFAWTHMRMVRWLTLRRSDSAVCRPAAF